MSETISHHFGRSPAGEPPEMVLLDNPIVDSTTPGLGEVVLHSTRHTGHNTPDRPLRTHRLFTVELDNYAHAVEITEPLTDEPSFTVMSLPGFTEHIEAGIRKKMHSHQSYIFPQARVISVASNGIGTTGGRYALSERANHGLQAMGEQRLKLAQALGGDRPLFVQGTSMGSVISHRMAQANLARPADEQLDLRGLFWLSPALVDPERIIKDMALRFPVGLAADLSKELLFKTSPAALVGLGRLARSHNFHPDDATALGVQMFDLLRGTPEADIKAVITKVATVAIGGTADSLTQAFMFERMLDDHPDKLHFEAVKGRGHGLAMKPGKACSKLSQAAHKLINSQFPEPPHIIAS